MMHHAFFQALFQVAIAQVLVATRDSWAMKMWIEADETLQGQGLLGFIASGKKT